MPSKYDFIIPSLPDLPPQDPSFQEKVRAFKSGVINDPDFEKTPVNLAQEYVDLRFAKDELEKQLTNINLSLEAFTQMLIESCDSNAPEWGTYGAEKSTLKMITGAAVKVDRQPYASVKDKEANRRWAIKEG